MSGNDLQFRECIQHFCQPFRSRFFAGLVPGMEQHDPFRPDGFIKFCFEYDALPWLLKEKCETKEYESPRFWEIHKILKEKAEEKERMRKAECKEKECKANEEKKGDE